MENERYGPPFISVVGGSVTSATIPVHSRLRLPDVAGSLRTMARFPAVETIGFDVNFSDYEGQLVTAMPWVGFDLSIQRYGTQVSSRPINFSLLVYSKTYNLYDPVMSMNLIMHGRRTFRARVYISALEDGIPRVLPAWSSIGEYQEIQRNSAVITGFEISSPVSSSPLQASLTPVGFGSPAWASLNRWYKHMISIHSDRASKKR
jgi:hypothetical protein